VTYTDLSWANQETLEAAETKFDQLQGNSDHVRVELDYTNLIHQKTLMRRNATGGQIHIDSTLVAVFSAGHDFNSVKYADIDISGLGNHKHSITIGHEDCGVFYFAKTPDMNYLTIWITMKHEEGTDGDWDGVDFLWIKNLSIIGHRETQSW